MALTQTRLAKVSNFAEDKTDLSPSVRTYMAIWVKKIEHFIRMRVPILQVPIFKDESTHLRDL